ncbi:nitroreductase family protein [Gillisia hiemivivida]|uniref:Nitroreductase family protein n=1 Tax=Gillisia hiemivivida TaxID=291190 RepID=A0A5C7A0V9_9FLAO|nr:nitroreductase family protein [Gillisia hiemivivida]TXD95322.1 nitroreductase family protein [Gillisia hiemivivida]
MSIAAEKKIEINGYKHTLFESGSLSKEELLKTSIQFFEHLDKRRSVRDFSDREVSKKAIENLIKSASTAPSGAHKQPWTFCAISNSELKSKIREAAEVEEQENYSGRMSESWLRDLAPLGTTMEKPFLEEAPWLIVVFKKVYQLDETGAKHNNYYVNESVGIACGMLITAIHNAGLVTLTHTPSPMNFLTKVLERPSNERAYLLLPVGYAKDPAYVPDIERKELDEVSQFYE